VVGVTIQNDRRYHLVTIVVTAGRGEYVFIFFSVLFSTNRRLGGCRRYTMQFRQPVGLETGRSVSVGRLRSRLLFMRSLCFFSVLLFVITTIIIF